MGAGVRSEDLGFINVVSVCFLPGNVVRRDVEDIEVVLERCDGA